MVRKKVEQMDKVELLETIAWYENRIKYIRFLIADKEL